MEIIDSVPRMDGYKVIADYDEQGEVFLIWPERPDNWRNGGKPAQQVYTKLANLISDFQPVTVLVNEDQYMNAKDKLNNKIRVIELSSNDAWMRDYGPVFLKNKSGHIRTSIFNFNAWGGTVDGLYFPWDKDNQVGVKISDLIRTDYYLCNAVIEGCAFQTDGEGTLITTEDVLLSLGRNGHATKKYLEKILKEYLGIEKVIWIKHGYFMDETNGDIENMLNYVKPGEIVLNWTNDETDPMYTICREAEQILMNSVDANNRHFLIHKMLLPKKQVLTEEEASTVDFVNGLMPRNVGQRLTANYVNYITLNKAIIFPIYNDVNDILARKTFEQLYPDKQIIGFPVREILIGGGGLRTVTLGIPKEVTQ